MSNESFSGIARAAAWGVILGGGIGFAMGMLLAPEEGQKLRRRLGFQAERISQEIGRLLYDGSGGQESSPGRERAESVVAEVEERAERLQNEMDELLKKFPAVRQTSSSN